MAEVRIGGQPAAALGVVSGLSWASKWGSGPSGPSKASWSLSLPFWADDSRLTVGTSVQVVRGGQTLWTGRITDAQRGDPWTLEAEGIAYSADRFGAVDAALAPTVNVQTAVTQAIARGLPWPSGAAFPSVAYGVVGNTVGQLDSLLTGYHDTMGLRWGCNRYGAPFSAADPTAPRWVLDGHDVVVGVADDELYTAVIARYQASATPTYASVAVTNAAAIARHGRREYLLDLTNLGVIASGTATTYATTVLNAAMQPSWLNTLTVTADRLTTLGGTPADLAAVEAGQMVRIVGIPGRMGRPSGSAYMDVVLGEVSYADGASEISLAPTRLAKRTLRDVVEGIQQLAATAAED